MHRVLLTGMSGTGKSTLLAALKTEENITVDLDYDGWIFCNPSDGERLIDIDRVLRLFESHPDKDIFIAGCTANQGMLRPYLTAIITLTAPLPIMRRRILCRTDNPYGRSPEEWSEIVRNQAEIEPLLIQKSHLVCDTDRDLPQILDEIHHFLMQHTDRP